MPYPVAPDSAHVLQDSLAITTAHNGTVGGVARVYDFGAATLWTGVWITQVTAMTTGSGRSYARKIQLSTTSDFASPIDAQPFTMMAAPGTDGEIAILLSNKISETVYRYAREVTTPAGSGASVTLSSWIIPSVAYTGITTPELAALMGAVTERFNQATALYRAWAGGLEDGGPDGDGKYPLSDAAGNTYLIECPARIVAMLAGGLTTAGVDALPLGDADDIDPTYPEPVFPAIVGPTGSRTLMKIPRDIFTSRRTRDLEPLVTRISDEIIPSWSASAGLERSISVREMGRQMMGLENALHYGVVPDCISVRRGFSIASGTNIVECEYPEFSPSSVGKNIQIANAMSGQAGKGTITSYIDSTHVGVSFTATSTVNYEDGNFGTLNTVAMQNALNACFRPGSPFQYGSVLLIPNGGILTGALVYRARTGIMGYGTRQSMLYRWDDSFRTTAFPRYDGDTENRPITQYSDGSYYYPIYPNQWIAPNYYGNYVPDVAPTLCNAIGTDAWGVTHSTIGTALGQSNAGQKVESDFNVFSNFSLNGDRYAVTPFFGGIEFRGGLFNAQNQSGNQAPYHQTDPYLRMRDMDIIGHGWVGLRTFGQCSALIADLGIYDNGAAGWHQGGYDNNVSGVYILGNSGPGLLAQGANTNWNTIKISYNGNGGFNWNWGETIGRANLVAAGGGDNYNTLRVQESFGANVYVNAPAQDFTASQADDTGCMGPAHMSVTPTWVTPAILLGPDAYDLRLNDFGMGAAIHTGDNYASHGIYWSEDSGNIGHHTSGRMYTKSIDTWYQPGSLSGDQTPNEWGADGGVLPDGTNIEFNGVDLSTL